jgi:hypothetical protein
MIQNPQKRNKDSKEAAEESIEQSTVTEGTNKTTEFVEFTGTGEEAKGTAMAGSGL